MMTKSAPAAPQRRRGPPARWWPSVYIDVKKRGDIVELYTKGWLPYTLRWSFRVLETKPDGFIIEAFGDSATFKPCRYPEWRDWCGSMCVSRNGARSS
jgi:hypothetical protein